MKIESYTKLSLLFLISQSNSKLQQICRKHLGNVSFTQAITLVAIFIETNVEDKQYSLKDIHHVLNISKSSLAQNISKLQSLGYVRRMIDTDDARRINVMCTIKGIKFAKVCIKEIDKIDSELDNLISNKKEQSNLVNFFLKLNQYTSPSC